MKSELFTEFPCNQLNIKIVGGRNFFLISHIHPPAFREAPPPPPPDSHALRVITALSRTKHATITLWSATLESQASITKRVERYTSEMKEWLSNAICAFILIGHERTRNTVTSPQTPQTFFQQIYNTSRELPNWRLAYGTTFSPLCSIGFI
jgi:hypothetical protein